MGTKINEVEAGEFGAECAAEILCAFANKHPTIVMSYNQWMDLREMIEREVCENLLVAIDPPLLAVDMTSKER